MAETGGSQKTARTVLIGLLASGLALLALMALALTMGAASRTPSDTPTPRLTNTPNVGAGSITPIEPGAPVPNVTLASTTGGEQSLSDFQSRYLLLYFGYTHCPDFCPTTMAKWAQVQQELGSAADEVSFVMISIDPRRDTTEVLADYLAQFSPTFTGLVADEHAVTALGPTFGLIVNAGDDQPTTAEATDGTADMNMAGHGGDDVPTYLVDHTIASYLIDRAGNLRAIFEATTPAADMRAFIESVMFADGVDEQR